LSLPETGKVDWGAGSKVNAMTCL